MHALKQSVIYILPLALMFACAGAPSVKKAPQWVTEPAAAYADSHYLTAVGYASSRSAAEAEAVSALTKSVSQKVRAHSVSVQTMESNAAGVERSFSSSVDTVSSVDEIAGLKIREVWTAGDGTVYARALVNREEVGSYYEQKMKDAENGINALIAFAADNPASFEAVNALRSAAEKAGENDKSAAVLSVVNPVKYKRLSFAYKNTQTVQALLLHEIENIHVAVRVKNDKDGRLESAFSEAVKKAGFKTVPGNSAHDADAPYILNVVLNLEPLETPASTENKYVRYTVKAELSDSRTGKIILPWSTGGREAHFTQGEAEQRALRTIEADVKKRFAEQFSACCRTGTF